jgi:5,10-methylenetetrahydromethanopterin reductase
MTRRNRWAKWGVLFSGDHLSLSEQLKLAADAESAGADSLWSAELWRDGFVPLAAMAMVARKARLGTGVAHFARTPLLTELSAMSMAELSGGRFVLGLGTAPKAWNENWHGLSYRNPVARMREYIECVRLMWTSNPQHPVEYDGQFYKIRDYRRLRAAAYDRIPIYLAAVLPGMMQLAGSHADGIIVNVLNTPHYFHEIVHPNVRQGLAVAGRGEKGFEWCAVKICSVNRDRKEARALARNAIVFYSAIPYFDAILDPAGFKPKKDQIRTLLAGGDVASAINLVTEEMIDSLVLAGTSDDVHRQLEPFKDCFETLLLLSPTFAAEPEQVRENHQSFIEAFAS